MTKHQQQEKSWNPGERLLQEPGDSDTRMGLCRNPQGSGELQTQLRREGRAQGRLSREGNHQQQPENSSQCWETLPAISRTWSRAGELEHPKGTDPTDPTDPTGPQGQGGP